MFEIALSAYERCVTYQPDFLVAMFQTGWDYGQNFEYASYLMGGEPWPH